jgi:hypothetical protein
MIALAGKACGICGGPIAANNRTGFCRRTAECRRAYYRAYNQSSYHVFTIAHVPPRIKNIPKIFLFLVRQGFTIR